MDKIESLRTNCFDKRQCDREYLIDSSQYSVLYLLTLPDLLNPGFTYLLVHCRSKDDCSRRCYIFESESSKFVKFIDTSRAIKHIDYKRPNLIIIIYYDVSEERLKQLDNNDFNSGTLQKKCRIYRSIHEIMDPKWWQRGTDLFPNEDLRLPGYLEFSDR
jgi:hypothetical protein